MPSRETSLTEDPCGRADLEAELDAIRKELDRRERYIEDFRLGVLKMLKDLDEAESELEKAYSKLKETRSQLIHSSRMNALGELSAGLAHELNQPMTVIKGLSQCVLKTLEESSPLHEKLRLINGASRKMEAIIKHLKVFSRAEAPVFSPVDINTVVKDAFIMVSELLLAHSIETVTDLEDLPPVSGSANRLEQVVINLVTNARDAMPDGGVIEIRTRAVEHNGRRFVRLIVKDSGAGIPEDALGRIFDPFFTTKEAGKGTGLGLSISYGIIDEHRGRITVASTPGKGTTFEITLPAIG